MTEFFLDFLWKGCSHYYAQRLFEFRSVRFAFGQGLLFLLVWIRIAICAPFLFQLVGRPYCLTPGTFLCKFFRECSHPPSPSLRMMTRFFPEREGMRSRSFLLSRVRLSWTVFLSLQSLRRCVICSQASDVVFSVYRNSMLPQSLSVLSSGLWSCIQLWTSSRLFSGPSWTRRELIGGR